ncbi:hypothetical protein [Streptomyces sp. NL15-2K]|uniref:hypothetical protein n=1 Tax=Streptomyces sp. NL15-2K TaxID=376149 RepID=UPI000F56D34A|nr:MULTISPECIES: hypothetical protein [Actinomycetes]WKX11801.1 hypothetical protein Q4V64_31555 [Kutzneria buriramensis]
MDRYVHHQLRAVVSILAAAAVAAAVVGVVRGFPPPKMNGLLLVALLLAFVVVSTLLKATRIKWVSEVRDFEAAVPVEGLWGTPMWSCRPTGSYATSRSARSSSCCI